MQSYSIVCTTFSISSLSAQKYNEDACAQVEAAKHG